ncbi:ATP-grasp domain-containing protein [Actinocorallia sp. B10E7]|uniref:ATP-grasp domain-containing protein n=1 Tax=Actinocorallia sp. B10E7 TaxID=3153558 RepID=UPI00325DBE5D
MNEGPLIVVGSGDRTLREYALAAMSERAPLALFAYRRPTWEKPYVTAHASVDLESPEHLVSEAGKLSPRGMITYDERLVESTARAAQELGLPGPGARAVALCKDKSAMRRALAETGLSPVGFATADDLETALVTAERIGYPVVLKPRALSGSIGVVRVDSPDALRRVFDAVLGARTGLSAVAHPGVLVEEFLDGPEYSVDAVTTGGETRVLVVAEKMIGFPPYFEETGHIVPARPAPGLDDAVALVKKAHAALGLDSMTTHTEVRLTSSGPRIVEINARLGGDLIPYLGRLALGVDAAGAAADVALGAAVPGTAAAEPTAGAAAVRLFYPKEDIRVRSVELPPVPGLDRFAVLAKPGEVLRLPPRGFLSRLAVAVVTGADHAECLERAAEAEQSLVVQGDPA